jgi:hypothetical protein
MAALCSQKMKVCSRSWLDSLGLSQNPSGTQPESFAPGPLLTARSWPPGPGMVFNYSRCHSNECANYADLKIISDNLFPKVWMARIGDVISLLALTVWTSPGRISTANTDTYQTGAYPPCTALVTM